MGEPSESPFVTLCDICLEVSAAHGRRCARCARRLCYSCTRQVDEREEALYCPDCVDVVVNERLVAANEAWLVAARTFAEAMDAYIGSFSGGLDRCDPIAQLDNDLHLCIHLADAERNGATERLKKRRIAERRRRITRAANASLPSDLSESELVES